MPAGINEVVLWFLYPKLNAKILKGTAVNTNNLCTNSLSIDKNKEPEVKMIKAGIKKQ